MKRVVDLGRLVYQFLSNAEGWRDAVRRGDGKCLTGKWMMDHRKTVGGKCVPRKWQTKQQGGIDRSVRRFRVLRFQRPCDVADSIALTVDCPNYLQSMNNLATSRHRPPLYFLYFCSGVTSILVAGAQTWIGLFGNFPFLPYDFHCRLYFCGVTLSMNNCKKVNGYMSTSHCLTAGDPTVFLFR